MSAHLTVLSGILSSTTVASICFGPAVYGQIHLLYCVPMSIDEGKKPASTIPIRVPVKLNLSRVQDIGAFTFWHPVMPRH